MKTRYGAWINLPGISTKEVAQIREVRLDSNSLYLFTVNYNNDKRALEDSMIEIFISAPSKDALRIEARHFSGNRKKMPKFELNLKNLPIAKLKTKYHQLIILRFDAFNSFSHNIF